MTELPRIPPTGPAAGIKAIKPVRRADKESRRRQRDPPARKNRDHASPSEDDDEAPGEESEPGKGGSINLRV